MAWKYVQRNENGQYKTTEGGGGGGSSTFADLEDVSFSNLQNGQVPKYNSTTQKWENANESGSSGHNYSTTEQVVGTWIDGRPVYEKVIDYGNNVNVGYDNTVHTEILHGISNFDFPINIFIICTNLNVFNDSLLTNSDGSICCKFRMDSTRLYASGGGNHYGATADRYWYFIIRYVKTISSS